MTTACYSYSKLSALKDALTQSAGSDIARSKIVYMLPSRSCEGILLDMLRTSGRYFGERPEIWGWSELYARLVPRAGRKRCIDPPDHRLILEFLLTQALSDLDARGIRVPGSVRRSGFVDILSDALKEMMLEDVTPDDILRSGVGEPSGELPARDLLYRLYTDYLLYLDGHGLADSSQIPSLAADAADRSESGFMRGKVMRWVGFLSFTGAQIRLVKSLSKLRVSMEFFTPRSGMENFRDAASQLGIESRRLREDACRVETMVLPDVSAQFEAVADEIVRIRGERTAEVGDDIGILTPPEHLRLMELALARRGIPYQARGETTVDRTAIYYIARSAWDAHRLGWPPMRTFNLLCAPQIGAGRPDGDRFSGAMPEGADMWRDFLKDDGRAARAFEGLISFCEYIDGEDGHTGEEILRALLELTGEWERAVSAEAGNDYDMDPAVREISSARVEIAEKLEMLGELFPSLGEAASVRFAGEEAMNFISDWGREATIALPPRHDGAAALYVSPPPALASHALWIMTDVDPGRYPGPSSDQPLLSGEIRADVNDSLDINAHLPTMHEEREQKEALFRRLAATGEYLTILARSGIDAGGRPQGDSPFMPPLPGEMFSGWSVTRGGATPPPESADGCETDRGTFPRVAVSKNAARDGKMAVRLSSVDAWALCPFSYWCGSAGGFIAPMDAGGVFGSISQGTVMHEIWRRIWVRRSQSGDPGPLLAALSSEWDGIVADISETSPLASDPRASLIMSELKDRMSAIAAWQDDTELRAEAAGLRRVRTETEFSLPPLEMDNAIFYGRADRVDFWALGTGVTAVIVDYKLGGGDAYKNSVQLACYAAALRLAGIDVGGVCYAGHKDARIRGAWSDGLDAIYGASGRRAEISEKIGEATETLRAMDEAIGSGRYPANYNSTMCRVCGCSSICRRMERYGVAGQYQDDADE